MIDSKQNGSKTTIIVKVSPILVIETHYYIKYLRILFFQSAKVAKCQRLKATILQLKN